MAESRNDQKLCGLPFDGTKIHSDTSPAIEQKMIELIRGMSPAKKIAKISDMGRFMQGIVRAEVRNRYPDASERDCLLRVASRSIPLDMMFQAFGWNVREKGY